LSVKRKTFPLTGDSKVARAFRRAGKRGKQSRVFRNARAAERTGHLERVTEAFLKKQ